MCRAACFAQTFDLTPLLPAPTPATEAIREAVLSGKVTGAAHFVESLDPATRELWRAILAIVRNDPTTAIRALRHAGQPKALGVAYYLARQYLLFRDQMAEAIRRDRPTLDPIIISAGTTIPISTTQSKLPAGSGKL